MMTTPATQGVFVYDGDCGICREWVAYWADLTRGTVAFRPWQEAAADHSWIPPEAFARTVHLFEPDGTVRRGADATFRLYRGHPPQALLPWLYRHVPGVAPVSEAAYTFLSRRRGLLAFLSHLFWGRDFRPPRWTATSWLFLRALGLIYLAAFTSFGVQAEGLIGGEGILPLAQFRDALAEHFGARAPALAPMVFWFGVSDTFITGVCIAGAVLSLCVIANRLVTPGLVLLYLLYLSLVIAGQTFMAFQWDQLLLEAGVLAIFLRGGAPVVVWLFR
jgi:predicted DCC family thiol-disulfide oxidoreductase YuxK